MQSMLKGPLHRTLVLAMVIGSIHVCSSFSFSGFVSSTTSARLSPRMEPRRGHRALAFGDYSEYPETCPFTTTCPLVCVANITDCPNFCEDGKVLCSDGFCEDSCDEALETPCLCESLSVACPKVINIYDACFEDFQEFYDADLECQEEEVVEQISFTGPAFLFCYSWISAVTLLVFLWCLFNQKLVPVLGSTVPFSDSHGYTCTKTTLTGYKFHVVGAFIHACVIFTFIGIQFLLLLLTIFYYMQQEAITRWAPVFYDEVQVLLAFIIVWMVSFFWCFTFQYPGRIDSLFLRRCEVVDATHIEVMSQEKKVASFPGIGHKLVSRLSSPFVVFLQFYFSVPYVSPGMVTSLCKVNKDGRTLKRHFYHRMKRYVLDEEKGMYALGIVGMGSTFADFMGLAGGLTSEEVTIRYGVVGPNIISVPKPTILRAVIKEFSKPFYLYQNFMLWSWAPYWYYYMAIVNTCVRLTSGVVVSVFQYMSDSVLYQLSHVEGEVEVLRDGARVQISVADIVPGDVVTLVPGKTYCDMVVLKTNYILVDESALTGESTPVGKQELDPAMYETIYLPGKHKSVTISAGTDILEVGENQTHLGLVLKTGSFTSKGNMLSDVLSYQRHPMKFDDEVKVVLLILVLEAIFLLGMVFYFLQEQWVYAWFYGIYVLGAVFPPLLPSVFVVSVGISAKRLQAKNISCTNAEGILVAGKVNAAFFDKTGTLTKPGMDFMSFDTYLHGDDKKLIAEKEGAIGLALAVCHGLTFTSDGEMVGNQIDFVSFDASSAFVKRESDLNSIELKGNAYSILKHFEFDTHRATQTVITEDRSGARFVIVKGSPEAISRICDASTVPAVFGERTSVAAKSGVYQIAVAIKDFPTESSIATVRRDVIEKEMQFCGVVNFRNIMKEDAPQVLDELDDGSIMSSMITGDHALSGIYVAREAGMIKPDRKVYLGSCSKDLDGQVVWMDVDSDMRVDKPSDDVTVLESSGIDLAVTGDAWTALLEDDPKYASTVAKQIRVFGRCNPSDKIRVVSHFIEEGYITLMCGDGQNDCGALKAAHVGISLSTSEASIVAPFTSIDKAITSTTEVLREGRCALASAFAAYKYYILYGQIEAMLQTINAYLAITFTEWIWVFLDGIWSITMAFSLPLSKAANRLSPMSPTASLLGWHTMFSACGLLAWNLLFLVIALLALHGQDWFQCRKWTSTDVSDILSIDDNYEISVLFVVGGYQYVSTAIALNFGYTFRQSWWKNYIFVFLAVVWTLFVFIMTLYPSSFSCIWRVNCTNEMAVRPVTESEPRPINNPWNTTVMPVSFRWILVGIMTANVLTLVVWEYFFVNGILQKWITKHRGAPSFKRTAL